MNRKAIRGGDGGRREASLRQGPLNRGSSVEVIAPVAFAMVYGFGAIGHLWSVSRPLMLALTPYVLLITGAVALAPAVREAGIRVLVWAVFAYVLTFAAEAVGVATGAVFGSYIYGPTLGVQAFGVPLVIGFNWVLVVLGAVRACYVVRSYIEIALLRFGAPRFAAMVGAISVAGVAAALLGVAFDVILEPVAMRFDYWQWAGGFVPLQNYVGWFFVGLIPAIVYFSSGIEIRTRVPVYYLVLQAVFFAVLLPSSL